MKISPNFSLEALTRSSTATRLKLLNQPDAAAITELQRLCANILEPLFAYTKGGFALSSGFRSVAVNRAVGSGPGSQHVKGQAADLIPVPPMTTQKLFTIIATSDLPYDQLIFEGTWVHVSTRPVNPRKQLLKAIFTKDGTTYRKLAMPPGPRLALLQSARTASPPAAKPTEPPTIIGATTEPIVRPNNFANTVDSAQEIDIAGLLIKQAGALNLSKVTGIVTTAVAGAMSFLEGKTGLALFAIFALVTIFGVWRYYKSKERLLQQPGITEGEVSIDGIEPIDTSTLEAEGATNIESGEERLE